LSRKKDGSCTLRKAEDRVNRAKFLDTIGIRKESFVSARLSHSNHVRVVGNADVGKAIDDTDGLITNEKGVFLSVTVADCMPIYLYDSAQKAIGLLHCGWRGLKSKIITAAIETMKSDFQSNPKDMLVGIGPAIQKCHYDVKSETLKYFEEYRDDAIEERDGKTFLDIKRIAERECFEEGILEEHIEVNPDCTYCEADQYSSYRREGEKFALMIAVFGIV